MVLGLGGSALLLGVAVSVAGAAWLLDSAADAPWDATERQVFTQAPFTLPDGTRASLAWRQDPSPSGRLDCRLWVSAEGGRLELPAGAACEEGPVDVGWLASEGLVVLAGRGQQVAVSPHAAGGAWQIVALPPRGDCEARELLVPLVAGSRGVTLWSGERCEVRGVGAAGEAPLRALPLGWRAAVAPLTQAQP